MEIKLNRRGFLTFTSALMLDAVTGNRLSGARNRVEAQEIEQYPLHPVSQATLNELNKLIKSRGLEASNVDELLEPEGYTNLPLSIKELDHLPVPLDGSPELHQAFVGLVKSVWKRTEDYNLGESLDLSLYLTKYDQDRLVALPMLQVISYLPGESFHGLKPDSLIWSDGQGQLNSVDYPWFASAEDTDIVVAPFTPQIQAELEDITGTITHPDGSIEDIAWEFPPLGYPIICTRDKATGLMKSLVVKDMAIIFAQFIPQEAYLENLPIVEGQVGIPEPVVSQVPPASLEIPTSVTSTHDEYLRSLIDSLLWDPRLGSYTRLISPENKIQVWRPGMSLNPENGWLEVADRVYFPELNCSIVFEMNKEAWAQRALGPYSNIQMSQTFIDTFEPWTNELREFQNTLRNKTIHICWVPEFESDTLQGDVNLVDTAISGLSPNSSELIPVYAYGSAAHNNHIIVRTYTPVGSDFGLRPKHEADEHVLSNALYGALLVAAYGQYGSSSAAAFSRLSNIRVSTGLIPTPFTIEPDMTKTTRLVKLS